MGFGYDGTKFSGFQKGIGKHSVEDQILSCINDNNLGTHFMSCSRTDRGVSAIMNTAALDTDLSPSRVLGTLNSSLEDIYFHKYAIVKSDFRVRYVTMKTYGYILPDSAPYNRINIDDLKPFEGFHDFRNFCKLDRKETEREINEILLENYMDSRIVIFRARGFLWNQIRFMIGYAIERVIHTNTPSDPFSEEYIARRLAPANLLILRDIKYPNAEFIDFPSRKKERRSRLLYEGGIINSFLGRELNERAKRK